MEGLGADDHGGSRGSGDSGDVRQDHPDGSELQYIDCDPDRESGSHSGPHGARGEKAQSVNYGRMQDSRSEAIDAQHGGNVNKTVVEMSERTLSIIAFGFAIAAFVVALWSTSDNRQIRDELLRSERESRVLQQQVMDQSALLLREGIRQPDDFTNGPSGNLNYHRKEK